MHVNPIGVSWKFVKMLRNNHTSLKFRQHFDIVYEHMGNFLSKGILSVLFPLPCYLWRLFIFNKAVASKNCRARLCCLRRMVCRSLMTVFPPKKVPQVCKLPPDDPARMKAES